MADKPKFDKHLMKAKHWESEKEEETYQISEKERKWGGNHSTNFFPNCENFLSFLKSIFEADSNDSVITTTLNYTQ